jgi:hypothetical protein
MKLKVKPKRSKKTFEYEYGLVYLIPDTHKRFRQFVQDNKIKSSEGINKLLDCYENTNRGY